MEEEARPIRQQQRRLNPTILDVVKKEVTKLIAVGIIYTISDIQWISLVQVVPKMSGMTIMKNQYDELVPIGIQNSWRVCIDYRKLNQVTRKDHFCLPFIDQVLEKLVGKSHYCFLDGFSRYMQIHITLEDQHKTTYTCPFGTFAYTRMRLACAMRRDCMEVFMDEFTVYADSFDTCLENLSKVLTRCIDTYLVHNFEKCHFMVTKGIVLGHLVSNRGIEVDKSKIDIITSLPNPASVQEPYVEAFQELKNQHTPAPILQAPNWDYPFELMCDASNSALGAVSGQKAGVGKPVHKSDAKSRLIRWMLLLREFNIEIRDKKGAELCIASQFSLEASWLYKERLKSVAKYYIWDDPYLWRLCNDQVIHQCIPDTKINSVLQFCHTIPGAIMDQLGQPEKCLIVGSIGPPISKTPINSSSPANNAKMQE
ncbi:Retrovirus-related Pol polyprotein, partial [Mucuna pruriens]